MDYRGNLSVLNALAGGEPVLGVVNGGGYACMIGLGVLVGLKQAGLNRFSAGMGSSGGACILAASFSNPEKLESVPDVFEHLALGGFLRHKWGPLGPYPVFDREELIQTLEGRRAHKGLPALNGEKMKHDPRPFLVVATNNKTGKRVLLDGRPDLFGSLRATLSIQGACAPVKKNGMELSDGQVGMGIGPSVGNLARKVLVILNRPPIEERAWWERKFSPSYARVLLRGETPELREAAAKTDTLFSRGLRRLEACPHIETLVIYPNWLENLWPTSGNVPLLRLAYLNARNYTERLIKQARAV
jgi:predicted patatin/cPLA2 family phospholipase